MYEYLKRAIQFSMEHLGKHGMPAGLYADWNDCLRLGKDGESTFVALQFLLCNDHFEGVCGLRKKMKNISHIWKKARKSLGND